MQHKYFAAANSSEGFKSYFGDVFGDVELLYIIKGGPGTGKSSFMKRLALEAGRRSQEVEYYLCSSDPESVDGVLISSEGRRIGILDGTSPHTYEPTYPAAREEILNFGDFWRSDIIRAQKNEIFALTNKKSTAYKRAYSYLRSCGNLSAVIDSLVRQATDFSKLMSVSERAAASLDLEKGELKTRPALISGVTMLGESRLDSFEKNAESLWLVGDFYGVGKWFLDSVLGFLKGYEAKARVSCDPINTNRTNGIFIEKINTAFVLSEGQEENVTDENTHFINPRRFIRTEKLREVRAELRYANKLYKECLSGALHALNEARVYHFLLEDIYKNAMDFAALNDFTSEFSAKMLK